jgi:type IX secretion system PorP/SprF family membrane protein
MKRIKLTNLLAIFFCAALLPAGKSYAQRSPIFTQYMFNGLVINPAYTGSQESMMLTASFRSQWSGIKGAPQTQVFTAHSPIKFSRSAGGLVAVHDKAGVIGQTMLYGTYAYHIPVSMDGKISVGAQAGATYFQANLSSLNIVTQNNAGDIAFAGNESHILPNLGVGAYYYTRATYIGLSIPTIINNKWNNSGQLETNTQQRHYFLTAGHVFELTPELKLKPNVLLKWVEGGPFQYDINANLFIKKALWVGLSYRMGDSVDGLFEWNINDQLAFGYSYGYPVNALAPAQWGTHEIVLNYRLKRDSHIIRSPRYF